MACAPDADPAVPRELQEVAASELLKERSVGHKAPPLGPDQTHTLSYEDSMKKVASHALPARSIHRTPAAGDTRRSPAPRYQPRRRRRDTTDAGMLRMPDVRRQYPRSRSTIYADIRSGTFTPPVSLGPRCSAWPAREVDEILAAREAGASDRQIRQLVARLIAERRP